ncbi:MAG TPA: carboxypeptidase-like regulatory domain-containing protein, partial [Pseudomonas sp.]
DAYENLRGDSAWVPGCDGADWRTSDGAGRFRIDSLEPGFYDIGRELVTLAAGETREAVIRHEGGGPSQTVLLGRLLDEDGLPVPGARISLEIREEKGTYYTTQTVSARSDGDGNYRLEFSKPEVKIGSYPMFDGFSRIQRPREP